MSSVKTFPVHKTIIKTAGFGSVGLMWSARNSGIRVERVLLSRPGCPAEKRAAELYPFCRLASCESVDALAYAIEAYLEGREITFPLRLVDLSGFSPFQQAVLRAQHAIPRGSVSTYGLIAARVGVPSGARAVGQVMAKNPYPLIIPCHRAILSSFRLGYFQSGAEMKRRLLEREGIVFDEKGKVVCGRLHYALI
jgi:methylated-DNA-[protein]-cysteine S-methyltransferase